MQAIKASQKLFVAASAVAVTFLVMTAGGPALAQDVSQAPEAPIGAAHEASSSGPGGMDPAVARKFGIQGLLGTLPEGMAATVTGEAPPEAAGPDRYLYTTLRVVNASGTRGCGYADWNCMTNLCKTDLGSAAWRG
jgi:hypothetical protein